MKGSHNFSLDQMKRWTTEIKVESANALSDIILKEIVQYDTLDLEQN